MAQLEKQAQVHGLGACRTPFHEQSWDGGCWGHPCHPWSLAYSRLALATGHAVYPRGKQTIWSFLHTHAHVLGSPSLWVLFTRTDMAVRALRAPPRCTNFVLKPPVQSCPLG